MELVGACECFHHLSALQVIEADGAAILVLVLLRAGRGLLFLLILEARDRVDDVLDLLGRWQRNSILI